MKEGTQPTNSNINEAQLYSLWTTASQKMNVVDWSEFKDLMGKEGGVEAFYQYATSNKFRLNSLKDFKKGLAAPWEGPPIEIPKNATTPSNSKEGEKQPSANEQNTEELKVEQEPLSTDNILKKAYEIGEFSDFQLPDGRALHEPRLREAEVTKAKLNRSYPAATPELKDQLQQEAYTEVLERLNKQKKNLRALTLPSNYMGQGHISEKPLKSFPNTESIEKDLKNIDKEIEHINEEYHTSVFKETTKTLDFNYAENVPQIPDFNILLDALGSGVKVSFYNDKNTANRLLERLEGHLFVKEGLAEPVELGPVDQWRNENDLDFYIYQGLENMKSPYKEYQKILDSQRAEVLADLKTQEEAIRRADIKKEEKDLYLKQIGEHKEEVEKKLFDTKRKLAESEIKITELQNKYSPKQVEHELTVKANLKAAKELADRPLGLEDFGSGFGWEEKLLFNKSTGQGLLNVPGRMAINAATFGSREHANWFGDEDDKSNMILAAETVYRLYDQLTGQSDETRKEGEFYDTERTGKAFSFSNVNWSGVVPLIAQSTATSLVLGGAGRLTTVAGLGGAVQKITPAIGMALAGEIVHGTDNFLGRYKQTGDFDAAYELSKWDNAIETSSEVFLPSDLGVWGRKVLPANLGKGLSRKLFSEGKIGRYALAKGGLEGVLQVGEEVLEEWGGHTGSIVLDNFYDGTQFKNGHIYQGDQEFNINDYATLGIVTSVGMVATAGKAGRSHYKGVLQTINYNAGANYDKYLKSLTNARDKGIIDENYFKQASQNLIEAKAKYDAVNSFFTDANNLALKLKAYANTPGLTKEQQEVINGRITAALGGLENAKLSTFFDQDELPNILSAINEIHAKNTLSEEDGKKLAEYASKLSSTRGVGTDSARFLQEHLESVQNGIVEAGIINTRQFNPIEEVAPTNEVVEEVVPQKEQGVVSNFKDNVKFDPKEGKFILYDTQGNPISSHDSLIEAEDEFNKAYNPIKSKEDLISRNTSLTKKQQEALSKEQVDKLSDEIKEVRELLKQDETPESVSKLLKALNNPNLSEELKSYINDKLDYQTIYDSKNKGKSLKIGDTIQYNGQPHTVHQTSNGKVYLRNSKGEVVSKIDDVGKITTDKPQEKEKESTEEKRIIPIKTLTDFDTNLGDKTLGATFEIDGVEYSRTGDVEFTDSNGNILSNKEVRAIVKDSKSNKAANAREVTFEWKNPDHVEPTPTVTPSNFSSRNTDSNSVFSKVINKIKNSLEDYKVSVMKVMDIDKTSLIGDLAKLKKFPGAKILVITDSEGKPLFFDLEGNPALMGLMAISEFNSEKSPLTGIYNIGSVNADGTINIGSKEGTFASRLDQPKDNFETKEKPKEVDKKDIDPNNGLNRGKELSNESTRAQELEAKSWFSKTPLAQYVKFEDFRNIVNSDAWATWKNSVITLWKGSNLTDLYHESWHEFSQLYLTKQQKIALYNEVSKTKAGISALEKAAKKLDKEVKDLTEYEKYFAIEELIAEDFRNYMVSGGTAILGGRPKRNNIFRKAYNFLKELFTGNVDLQTYYERLRSGNINQYKRSIDNGFFSGLNSAIEGVVNGEVVSLSNQQSRDLVKGLDSLILNMLKGVETNKTDRKNIVALFQKGNVKELLNEIRKHLESRFEEPLSAKDEANLRFIIQNWETVVVPYYRQNSQVINQYTSLEEFEEEEAEEQSIGDTPSELIKNENKNLKTVASKSVRALIAALPRYENGKPKENDFLSFLGDTVDIMDTWKMLVKTLEGTQDYSDMLKKLRKLGESVLWVKDLLEQLPSDTGLPTDDEMKLKAQFVNDLGKPKVDLMEVVMSTTEKNKTNPTGLTISLSEADNSNVDKLTKKWNQIFLNNANEKNPYVVITENGEIFLNTKQLIADIPRSWTRFNSRETSFTNSQVIQNRLNFLKALGIVFSDNVQNDPGYLDFIATTKPDFDHFYNEIYNLSSTSRYNLKDHLKELRLKQKRIFNRIANFELKYNTELFNFSVKNADGESVFLVRQWNYLSKAVNFLNGLNSLTELKGKHEEWLQYSWTVNPFVKGVYLQTMFDESGNRRKDSDGNPVKLTLIDYNGLKDNRESGRGKNPGKVVSSLNRFEKFVQNLNSLLRVGVQENIRNGDKPSSFAIQISHHLDSNGKLVLANGPVIPVTSFAVIDGGKVVAKPVPTQALEIFKGYIKQEIITILRNRIEGVGNTYKNYSKGIQTFGIFEDILSQEVKDYIYEYIEKERPNLELLYSTNTKDLHSKYNEIANKAVSSSGKSVEIYKNLTAFIKAEVNKNLKEFKSSIGSLDSFIDGKVLAEASNNKTVLTTAYTVNAIINNIEYIKLIANDPRFYKVSERIEVIEEKGEDTQQVDTAERIYNELGNKTKSENVVIKPWDELKDVKGAIVTNELSYKDWANNVIGRFVYTNEVLRENQITDLNNTVDLLIQNHLKVATFAKEDLNNRQYLPFINRLKENGFKQVEGKEWLFTKNGIAPEELYNQYKNQISQIISTRIKNTNEHFGNPYSHDPAGKTQGLIKTETIQEAVEKYIDWVINSKNNFYTGKIKPEPNTIFVFGSNPEGRHGAGAAKIAKEQFGAIYGQGEGLQGNAYALPTKDLRVKENNSLKSIDEKTIINSIKKLYEVAKQNPARQFKIAYTNTTEKSLNGYTGIEMIEMFNQAGEVPNNIVFSEEWNNTGKLLNSRAEWIREELKSGEHKGKPILYYKELGEPSHATALDYLINKHDWNSESTASEKQQPSSKGKKVSERVVTNALDFFKRLSGTLGSGPIYLVDSQTNEFITNKGNALAEALGNNTTPTDGSFGSVIFNKIINNSEEFLKHLKETFKDMSEERFESLYGAYRDIEEGDGQGYITLDFLRQSKLRLGSDQWTKDHERAYQKEAAFLRGESTEGMSMEEASLFTPEKHQYSGISTLNLEDKPGRITKEVVPLFYKFSTMPLIPSMIQGTKFEEINKNMLRQGVGMGLFDSGSKLSQNQKVVDDKLINNNFTTTGKYIVNKVFFTHLKEQVNIDKDPKESVIFSTQLRKLLFSNLFENGRPVNERAEELRELLRDYTTKLIHIEEEKLYDDMGFEKVDGVLTFNNQKLAEFFKRELEQRGLPKEAMDFFKVKPNGDFEYPIEASKNIDQLQKIFYSIMYKRLVRLKTNGNSLIQVAPIGFNSKTSVSEDDGVPFYRVTKDGTKAGKVKIPMSRQWKPLLNLIHPDGKKIQTLERLNALLKNEEWLNENSQFITITAVRIPVQEHNSMEFFEVYEFLPEAVGNVCIISPQLAAKSGGDFDIDKLTSFFPNIHYNKYTGKVQLYSVGSLKASEKVRKGFEDLKAKVNKNLSSIKKAQKELSAGIKTLKTTKAEALKDLSVIKSKIDELESFYYFLDTIKEDLDSDYKNYISDTLTQTLSLSEAKGNVDYDLQDLLNRLVEKRKEYKDLEDELYSKYGRSFSDLKSEVDYNYSQLEVLNSLKTPATKYLGELEELIFQSSEKEAYQNGISDIIKEVLSMKELSENFLSVNSTDLLKTIAEEITTPESTTYSSLILPSTNLSQHSSNFEGKDNLGISAVGNTFYSLSQQAGLRMNKFMKTWNEKKELVKRKRTRLLFKHNGDEDYINLSSKTSENGRYFISKVFAQFINGFVDVTKDDWVFKINAIKEFVPSMLYMSMAGVDIKSTIYYFNTPIMNRFKENVEKYNPLWVDLKGDKPTILGLYDTLLEIIQSEELENNLNSLVKQNSKTEDVVKEIKDLIKKEKDKSSFVKDYEEFSRKFVSKINNLVDSNIPYLFTEEHLRGLVKGKVNSNPLADLIYLSHFMEIKAASNAITNLQQATNLDTNKISYMGDVASKEQALSSSYRDQYFEESSLGKFINESVISGFTNEGSNITGKVKTLISSVFPLLTNNTLVRTFIDETIAKEDSFKKRLYNNLTNDFIAFLYQNTILNKDKTELLYDSIRSKFTIKRSIYNDILEINKKYPKLKDTFTILGRFVVDNDSDNNLSNLKLDANIVDADEIDEVVGQFRALINLSNSDYTIPQQEEIKQFTQTLLDYLVIQSFSKGSIYNLTNIIPNEQYTRNFGEVLDVIKESFKNTEKFDLVMGTFLKLFNANNKWVKGKYVSSEARLRRYISPDLDLIGLRATLNDQKLLKVLDSLKNNYSEAGGMIPMLEVANNENKVVFLEDNLQKTKQNAVSVNKKNGKYLNAKVVPIYLEISKGTLMQDSPEARALVDAAIKELVEAASKSKGIVLDSDGYFQKGRESIPGLFNYVSSKLFSNFGFVNKGYFPDTTLVDNEESPSCES